MRAPQVVAILLRLEHFCLTGIVCTMLDLSFPARIILILVSLGGWRAPIMAAPVPGAELFASDKVLRFQIEIASGDLESLRKEPREYVTATVRADQVVCSNVAVHLKGRTGSFRGLDDKPSLTLDFEKLSPTQRLYGLSKIHLNNSVEDPSYLNEALGAELFRGAGLPAARVAHALVELNGRQLGLYVLKEGFTREFLGLHFKRTDGNLYENDPTDEDHVRMKRNSGNGADDESDLKALAEAAQEPDLARRWQRLQEELELDRFLTFMAVELMAGHRDGYCLAANNYRLYFDPEAGRFNFLPHGMDQLFGRADLPLRANMGGPVARAVMEVHLGRRLYLERAAMLLTNVFRVEALTNRVEQLSARLSSTLNGEAAREQSDAANRLAERIVRRLAHLGKQLSEPEMKPIPFDNGVAKLTAWRAVDVPEGGGLEQAKAPDGRSALHINAGPVTSASWRSRVLLAAGRYRFEGAVRTGGVKALSFGKNKGAGLRVSTARLAAPHQLSGDSPWTHLKVEFELSAPETDLELICELRASAGDAWFDAESLRLVRLK
jgi:hypothetical protein